jgi:hypothetical protein
MIGGSQVRPDGTFTISGLASGTYTLRAQRIGAPGDAPEIASATIPIEGVDVEDVHLVGAKPSTLSGRVVVDPAAIPSLPRPLMIAAQPASSIGFPAPPPPPAVVADDFTFQIKAPPGVLRLFVGGNLAQTASAWVVRAVRVNGQDVTDAGVEVKPNEDVGGVEVELTNRITTVMGGVTNGRGEAAKDYTAIVFVQDKEKWTSNARYPSSARPDQDGRFKITALPPGEYYIIAIDRVDPGQIGDPDFLESLRTRATSFSLREGETRTFDLRLNTGT